MKQDEKTTIMDAKTLPKTIATTVTSLTKNPWTTLEQADAAADFIRELRLEANALGALTDEELAMKRQIDAKLAAEAVAVSHAKTVEATLKPYFITFTQDETERVNSSLPVSKHRKYIEGKGWKVQLKDKPGQVLVTNQTDAVKWLETNQPTAVKVVKTVDMSEVANESVLSKLKKLGAKLVKAGFSIVPAVPDGNSSLKIQDLDIQ